ncbi:amidase [Arthrobacter sp. CAU 1506]|uniref:amidase family protein n=1 Tax=Arthrobacter sp. CAU 1506 TaxID=2560052 RepID=UPI0010AC2875|nr:amidase [Arthrobacter sp. CAU 1506]TJY66267.1 amidase [Arthrobacter sp. CAU 1506]
MSFWQPWSLRDAVAELRRGGAAGERVAARSIARIEATDPTLHAWAAHEPQTILVPDGPLGGVPLGVKDIIDVEGYPTKCGSGLRADAAPADKDAAIVSAWRVAGAVPVGKTVTTEFAFFAPGPTRNPASPAHTPGGSSSGSAAAVASGQVPIALGSQTAGSVTRPGAYCGVASLVMTHGRYPGNGIVGLSKSLDSHGVYTATVSDLALAWSALTGDPDVGLESLRPPRLLLWTAAPLDVVSVEMSSALSETLKALRAAGAVVDLLPLEQLVARVTAAHPVEMAYEAARERSWERDQADLLSAALAHLLRTGAGIAEAEYAEARMTIARATDKIAHAMVGYDAVIGPGAPGAAPADLDTTGDPVLSRAWQALGLPAVGVPGLRDSKGLPLGLQIVGKARDEIGALRAAVWVERVLTRRPSRRRGSSVVGAATAFEAS